jgi:hypothetical protein
MVTERDFLLPPWSVEGLEACFFVSDGTGQKLAYVYFEDDPGRRTAAKLDFISRKVRSICSSNATSG